MNTKRMNIIYFTADCILMVLCYLLTWYIVRKYFFVYVWTINTGTSFLVFYLISLGLIPFYLCMHKLYHFYDSKSVKDDWNGLITVGKANFISVFLFEVFLYLGGRNNYIYMFPHSFSFWFFMVSTALIVIERKCIFTMKVLFRAAEN